MTTSNYPLVERQEDVIPALKEIGRLREQEDVPDFDNLQERFVSGRSTDRIPTSPTDTIATDNVGDVTNDGTYEYKLLDIGGGVLNWDRRSLDIAW